jgi:hypothetical protein
MSLKSDWNYVKRAMRTPCENGNIGLYVETAFAAAGIGALDVLSFGCREPLKFALGRGQVKEMFGTKSRKGIFPSGHRKPKAGGTIRPPTVSAGPSFFWHFEGLFERALFMMLLVEIGKDFFLNWHSLLNAANGCDGAPAGYCQFNVTPQIIGPGETDMLIGALPNCHGVLSDLRAVYIPQGITASISYHVKSEPWVPANNPQATLSTRLFDDTDNSTWAASDQGPRGSGSNGTVGFQHHVPAKPIGFRKISIRASGQGGYCWCPEGKLELTLAGHEVKWFHPTDCFKDIFGDPTRGEGFFANRPPHG